MGLGRVRIHLHVLGDISGPRKHVGTCAHWRGDGYPLFRGRWFLCSCDQGVPLMYRSTQRSEIDENLIDDFSSEAPVADFPQPQLEHLEASFDIDWNGRGVLTLAQPRECICCGHQVTWAR